MLSSGEENYYRVLEIQAKPGLFMVRGLKDEEDEEEVFNLYEVAFEVWDASKHFSRLNRINDEVSFLFKYGAYYSLTTDSIGGFKDSAVIGYIFSESLLGMAQACPGRLNVFLTEVEVYDSKLHKYITFKAGDVFGNTEDGKTLMSSSGVNVAILFIAPVLQGKVDMRQATVAAWRSKVWMPLALL